MGHAPSPEAETTAPSVTATPEKTHTQAGGDDTQHPSADAPQDSPEKPREILGNPGQPRKTPLEEEVEEEFTESCSRVMLMLVIQLATMVTKMLLLVLLLLPLLLAL